jgi:branched-chain amino acid transport system substrate-binding protein
MPQPSRRNVLGLMLAGAGGYYGFPAPAIASSSRGVSEKAITLGCFLPLTGPAALVGEQVRIGATSYVDMVNAAGGINGRKIKFVVEDTAWSVPQTIAAVKKMVAQDGVFALLASNGNPQIEAILPYALQNDLPIIAPYAGQEKWSKGEVPGFYGTMVPFEVTCGVAGRMAAKDGHKKVAITCFDALIGRIGADLAKAGFLSVDGTSEPEISAVKIDSMDLAPVALRISRSAPDAVVSVNFTQQFFALARALRDQGVKVPIYSIGTNVLNTLIPLGPELIEGVKAASWTVAPTTDNAAVNEYRQSLKASFPQQTPDFTSLLAYGGMKVFFQALRQIEGVPDTDKLYACLESMKNYDTGILPPITFAKNRRLGTTQLWPAQVRNGKWEIVGELVDYSNPQW